MILLIGGTSETAPLAEGLARAGYDTLVSTATRIPLAIGDHPRISRRSGRLDEEGLVSLVRQRGIGAIVDAAHPYAVAAHRAARAAAARLEIPYLAFRRAASPELPGGVAHRGGTAPADPIRFASDHAEAARLAFADGRPVLLTTGSRNLAPYAQAARRTGIPLAVRILDAPESHAACRAAGISAGQVITGRGPFSIQDNLAAIRRFAAGVVVTKESGGAGGIGEKLEAAARAGCRVVVIRRPEAPAAHSFDSPEALIAALAALVPPSPEAQERDSREGVQAEPSAKKDGGQAGEGQARHPQGHLAWLTGLCLSRTFYAFIFTTYAAALPLLKGDWGMSAGQAGLVQSAWHAGYMVSLFTVGFLADRYGARRTFLAGSVLASVSALAFAFFADGFLSGMALYGLTGLCSGASYTPGLTLVAERFAPLERGRAMGWFLAAASFGYGASLLLSGLLMPPAGWRGAFVATACGPLVATLIAFWTLRDTPNLIHRRPSQLAGWAALRTVWKNRPAMLLIWAYVFHAWELLGMWAWMPAFLAASIAHRGATGTQAAGFGALLTALTYITSMSGSIFGGDLSDRWGRTRAILWAACLSLACSFTFGWMMALPLGVLVAAAALYNISAIADSSVYSTGLTELVPAHCLGAAYALRSLLGFGAGILSPWVFGLVIDWARGGPPASETMAWGLAWTALGAGAMLGPLMTVALRAAPESKKMAGGKR